MSGEQIIFSDGTIQLPMVGSISITGLSPGSASEAITTALTPYAPSADQHCPACTQPPPSQRHW